MEATAPRPLLQLPCDAYTVGWVCALPKEMAAAIAMLDEPHERPVKKSPNDDNSYKLGSINGHNIVIACLPYGGTGTTSAATVAMKMISTFQSVRVGLMVGIGGGVSRKVRLGDVVVSLPDDNFPGVVQWDMGKAEFGSSFTRKGSLNKPPASLTTTIASLMAHHLQGTKSKVSEYLQKMLEHPGRARFARPEQARDILFKASNPHKTSPDDPLEDETDEEVDSDDMNQDGCKFCDKTQVINRRTKERLMKIHYGLIASGNQVIKDPAVRDRINHELGGKVLCVEMEAAGLMDNFPCIVIRGISDYADSHKNDVWQEHAAAVAAAFAKEFLTYLHPNYVEVEKPAHEIMEKLQTIEGHVKEVVSAGKHEATAKILEWVTDVNFGEKHSDCLRKRLDGTGKWLLDTTEYREWFETPSQILLCSGMPGAGKTIMTSTVIEHLERHPSDTDTALAYLYCDYKKKDNQNFEELMLSLLKQLAGQKRPLPSAVRALYDLHAEKYTRPQYEDIKDAFRSVASKFSRVFVIVDALDEYSTEHESHKDFVERLLGLQEDARLSLFVTSRPIDDITDNFSKNLHITMAGNETDIRQYLTKRAPGVISFTAEKEKLIAEIVEKISKASKGMFLLATFQLDSLKDKVIKRDIQAALTKISESGHSTQDLYDSVYTDTMKRICGQLSGHKKQAMQVLGWLTHSMRPLKLAELQHALEMASGRTTLEFDDLFQADYLSSICAGLVTVDKVSDIVHLVHYTTQEYLEKEWFPNFQSTIVTNCVNYLSLQELEILPWSDGKDSKLEQAYPLYDYAIQNWLRHARQISSWEDTTTSKALISYLKKDIRGIFVQYRFRNSSWTPRQQTTGLHLGAALGCRVLILEMLKQHDVNEKDSSYEVPLGDAIQNGQLEAAQLLIDEGAEFQRNGWALKRAFHLNDLSMIKLFVEHRSFDKASLMNMQWLFVTGGGPRVWEHLLRCGIGTGRSGGSPSTALHEAIVRNQVELIEILLENGEDLEEQDPVVKKTPLSFACGNLYVDEGTIKTLIQHNANVDAADHTKSTPLLLAIERGKFGSAKCLLETGANANIANRKNTTPLLALLRASVKFRRNTRTPPVSELIKLLLDKGASVDAVHEDGTTALSFARDQGMKETVAILEEYSRKRNSVSDEDPPEIC